MARKVIWSRKAQDDRLKIFDYWNKRNGTTNYSEKLFYLFKGAIELIKVYPEICLKTEIEGVRSKLVKGMSIILEAN